ncbi:MAG: hypothetical protein EWM51_12560 [Treponema sp.]|nr:MAG: hypothetical protein EWM51_12560 [Treponema sp.]
MPPTPRGTNKNAAPVASEGGAFSTRREPGRGQEGGKAMLDGEDYPDYEGAILEEQENEEYYGDI